MISGGGVAASLGLTGNVGLGGAYSFGGALTVGSEALPFPYDATFASGSLALAAGGSIAAGSVNVIDGELSLAGASSLSAGGSVTIGAPGGISNGGGASSTASVAAGATLDATGALVVAEGSLSVSGAVAAGTLTVGTAAVGAGTDASVYQETGGISVSAGGSLTVAGTVALPDGVISVTGAGSKLVVTGVLSASLGSYDPASSAAGSVVASAGGAVRLGGAVFTPPPAGGYVVDPPGLSVDDLSSIEIGTSGGAAAGAITVDAGDSIDAGTSAALTGALVDDGTVTVSGAGATLTQTGDVTGSGVLQIGKNATLLLDGAAAASDTITFLGAAAALSIGTSTTTFTGTGYTTTPFAVAAAITGFQTGDSIILGQPVTAATFNAGAGTLTLSDGSATLETLRLVGDFAGESFLVSPTTAGGDSISLAIVCYAAGTRIATADGEAPVETLRPGDMVATVEAGKRRLRPVRWVGRRRIDLLRHLRPEEARPVRIRAGAFAEDVPHRDLLVSPEHCVFTDGALIPARLLLNGGSVSQDGRMTNVDYFHVELDRHALLLAEGLPAESYLDTGNRSMFDRQGLSLFHPECGTGAGHMRWATDACAPLAVDPTTTEPIWRRLRDRSVELGFAPALQNATCDPMLQLEVDGTLLNAVHAAASRHLFVLSRPASVRRLVSRAARPSDTRPWLDDRRLLGVCVRRLVLPEGCGRREVPLDQPLSSTGWHEAEGTGANLSRWTNGCADIPATAGIGLVEVTLAGEMRYPTSPTPDRVTANHEAAAPSRAA